MENLNHAQRDILIRIPPWVVDGWESVVAKGEFLSNFVSEHYQAMYSVLFANQRNSFFVILSMILFWPFYAYCFVAVTSASTWIIWLLASVLVGIVQMNFVAYQFFMISVDIFALTLLKTYQVSMRSRAAQFVFFFSNFIMVGGNDVLSSVVLIILCSAFCKNMSLNFSWKLTKSLSR